MSDRWSYQSLEKNKTTNSHNAPKIKEAKLWNSTRQRIAIAYVMHILNQNSIFSLLFFARMWRLLLQRFLYFSLFFSIFLSFSQFGRLFGIFCFLILAPIGIYFSLLSSAMLPICKLHACFVIVFRVEFDTIHQWIADVRSKTVRVKKIVSGKVSIVTIATMRF